MKKTVTSTSFSVLQILPAVLTVAVAMLLVMMDSTIMNIAIPTLQHAFHTDLATIQWTVTGYTLALAAMTPLAGWLSDRFGAKRIFVIAIASFTLCSVACSLTNGVAWLIALRAVQGLAGGLVGPVGMAMSWQIIPNDKRGALMGLLGLPLVVAPIMGPILSGWLLAWTSWRAIFLINLPIGGLALILVVICLPTGKRHSGTQLDLGGAVLSPLAFSLLIYGIHRLGNTGLTDPVTVAIIGVGSLALVAFIWTELHHPAPLMAITAFRSGRFTRGILVSWLNQIVLFGVMLLVPLFLQTAKGVSPLHAGEMVAPQALAAFVGMILGGRLFDRCGIRAAALPGVTLMMVAVAALTQLTTQTSTIMIMLEVAVLGLGQGLTMMQISTYNMGMAPQNVVSRITPLINGAMQLVNSLAVVLLTNVLAGHLRTQLKLATASTVTAHTVVAYALTFRIPLLILIGSWILVWTLTKRQA